MSNPIELKLTLEGDEAYDLLEGFLNPKLTQKRRDMRDLLIQLHELEERVEKLEKRLSQVNNPGSEWLTYCSSTK